MHLFYLANNHSYHFSELVKSKTKLLLFFDRNTLVFILMRDNRVRMELKPTEEPAVMEVASNGHAHIHVTLHHYFQVLPSLEKTK